MAFELSDRQKDFLDANGNTLVTGGAGSGKTTIAILKAAALSHTLNYESQKILFLSFARPTIARVEEAIQKNADITKREKSCIEVDTYHSFFWRLIKSHGYLLGLPHTIEILEGYNEAELLLPLREKFGGKPKQNDTLNYESYIKELNETRWNVATQNGKIAFDLFAPTAAKLLSDCSRIRNLTALKYPYIILDEFQDTDGAQWNAVTELGKSITLVALADPEQQIYRWKGADPQRLAQYVSNFSPTVVDFQQANFRSAGTDIANFGNEILTQSFSKTSTGYNGIEIRKYGGASFCNKQQSYMQLNLAIIEARKRLVQSGKQDWSLAILTGSKDTTKKVSELMSAPPSGCAKHTHRPIFDLDAAILGAAIVSALLEQNDTTDGQRRFIDAVLRFLRGRNGDSRPKADYIRKAADIEADFSKYLLNSTSLSAQKVCSKLLRVHGEICKQPLTGDPAQDWITVRQILENSNDARLRDASTSTRFLRLIERNTDLRSLLKNDWQENGAYENAFRLVSDAFVQEHFSLGKKPENGLLVMNIHKSKGKEFDEVILFDGFNNHNPRTGEIFPSEFSRICFSNAVNDDTKQNFRVAVTRARNKTTILTPRFLPCALLDNLAD
ncbi:MAG: ATP-dependent helicase [Rhizobiales bacterium]|nr:ATP-dependent helicase [Hyphomicrobiales bacterium]MBO6699658.1 ATP-dependent helicase [Hyphomicrobiales bacterium]MBO6737196.1 ATP-dependent helicase [Hyphomicrobiales bacterium]MBO6911730.1 ATP-dependent helicase [Hyphomicrobiales bacterium]MBO6954848.1 ATP-dependent helicase [Hyphomicrobiales bacterium]